jgi:phosphatidylserine/phosphatidylglycerophosphate/cardiolipin synthase-like enzyme
MLITVLLSLACQISGDADPTTGITTPHGEGGDAPVDWYKVYFTAPDDPSSESLRGGPDRTLADAIRAARLSVDVAAQQLDLWSMRDALIDAHRRGVAVRLVTESDYLDEKEVQELIEAGVPVLGDRREGLMHNKFVVIDRIEVWTGSMNLTINGVYRNNNNLIRIRSSRLAENYTTEFDEMFVDDRFGPGSPANTPHPSFGLDSTLVEVYFSPEDGTADRLLELIAEAQESINFLTFSFTSDDLAEALIVRARDGVSVAGVFEESQYKSNTGTEYDKLLTAGLDVRLDGNPRQMHHKVLIIDEEIVITGSYNLSFNAENKNDENTLIIHRPDLAAEFLAEFKQVYAEAKR